jgi:hypothetical protein
LSEKGTEIAKTHQLGFEGVLVMVVECPRALDRLVDKRDSTPKLLGFDDSFHRLV